MSDQQVGMCTATRRARRVAQTPTIPGARQSAVAAPAPDVELKASLVRVLLVEDSAGDAEMIERALREGELIIESRTVATESELRAALATFAAQIVIVDWTLSGFSGAEAMAIVRDWDDSLPCIVVSGKLGYQLLTDAIRTRATDHVSKRHMEALVPAVRRALAETAAVRDQARLEKELRALRGAMAEALDAMADPFVMCTAIRNESGQIADFRVRFVNTAAAAELGRPKEELVGRALEDITGAALMTRFFRQSATVVETGVPFTFNGLEVPPGDGEPAPGGAVVDLTVSKHEDGFFVVWRNVTARARAIEALAASERRLHTAFDTTLEGLSIESAIRDERGRIVDLRRDYVNPAIGKMAGMEPADQVGRTLLELFPACRDNGLFDEYVKVIETGVPFARDGFHYTDSSAKGGSLDQYLDLRAAKMGDAIVFSVRDVTERVEATRTMARLGMAISQATEMVVITDASGTIEFVNSAVERVTGYSRDELIGANPRVLKSGRHPDSFYTAMWAALARGQPWAAEFVNRRKDGSMYVSSGTISPIRDETGAITGYVGSTRDVTDERAREERSLQAARERGLIAATIRAIDTREPPEVIAQAVCDQVATLHDVVTAGLYVFELDGHAAQYGFAAPVDSARRPQPIARQATAGLRVSAERGPWIQDWRRQQGHAHNKLYARLGVKALAYAPVRDGGVLIGVLVVSSAIQQALADALPALVEFADLIGTLIGPNVAARTETEVARARICEIIDEAAFHPVYQPIVDIAQGQVVGYEALTRFDDGVRPDTHFARARAIGMGEQLEAATLRAAIDGSTALQPDAWLSLNVSPSVVGADATIAAFASTSARQLVLEVTEHEPIADYAALLRDVGRFGPHVRLAVDDAGAGFASLRHILQLQAVFVKLDRDLIANIDNDPAKQALVAGMRHFANSTGAALIAEGVETMAELASLRELDVHFAQGYLLGRPLPAGRLTSWKPLSRRTLCRASRTEAQRPPRRTSAGAKPTDNLMVSAAATGD